MPATQKSNASLLILLLLVAAIFFLLYKNRQQKKEEQKPNARLEKSVPGDNSNLLLGNPTGAVADTKRPDNYLVDHTYYVESYNNQKGAPNWVSWHLGSADLGDAKRQDDYRPDESLPAGFFKADNTDFKNSGFDKGHNCPSGDRTASEEANASTFVMNNIIPQAPNNNQNVWEHLESYCRSQVKKGNEAYVIMGNYGTGGTGKNGYKTTIANGKINVPAHIWKVAIIMAENNNDLARINAKTNLIAVDTPNDNVVSNNWMDYLTTVDAIEEKCNCDLLSALPKELQRKIEAQKFKGGE